MGQMSITLTILLVSGQSLAHVSLMWPPARGPGLDFLDSFRTQGDCGMEQEPRGPKTLLKCGSLVNVTWHLGYPHGGGHKVELIDPAQDLSMTLLPQGEGDWVDEGAKFSQSDILRLPDDVECDQCYLRLQRQATEWGKKYIFRSCADLTLTKAEVVDTPGYCGKGRREAGGCVCPKDREGDRCQYSTDCKSDSDCNGDQGHGKCIAIDNTVYRIGQCFCAAGWMGTHCEKQSEWSLAEAKDYRREDYKVQELKEGVELLWKKVGGDNVELIMKAKTNSWVGVGWRPKSAQKNCQKFPEFLAAPIGRDFNAMDCNDMVIGAARGSLGRVGDYYTRDRSTPRLDEDFGGESNLVSSVAWQEDGVTTVRLLKQAKGGTADWPLKGKLHLIWAHGQDSEFYKPDQLKYHSRRNRGKLTLDMDS